MNNKNDNLDDILLFIAKVNLNQIGFIIQAIETRLNSI